MSIASPPRVTLAPFGVNRHLAGIEQPSSIPEAIRLAVRLGDSGLLPGEGETAELWETLATLAAHDLGVARAVEPHLDAIAILEQAGQRPPRGSSWGVFAAEGGDDPLVFADGVLRGTKVWCSLAGSLDRALVTAGGQLFSVDLTHPGVGVEGGTWHARGLTEIPSGPVRFELVPGSPVGEPGWYLSRQGFAWGGIGVAACWFGGAVGVARRVFDAAVLRSTDPLMTMHLGVIDESIGSARRALAEAAALIDAGEAAGRAGEVLAKRTRATVVRSCELVLSHAGHALGPAPLALDEDHAKRVADLTLYIRQHHAERDEASLGAKLLDSGELPW